MVRYVVDDFLTEYSKFLKTATGSKRGSVELSMKRYDASEEARLDPNSDKTDIPRERRPKQPKKKTAGSTKANPARGAANPESTRNKKAAVVTNFKEPAVLIRARFGLKKASCVIPFKAVPSFQEHFGTIFRLHHTARLVAPGQISETLAKRKSTSKKQ